jgi:GH15 family glucan-1,4-alpha-glucosidase
VTAPAPGIADLAFLSDCRSAAMVSRDGSVVWWCPERFDGPSVFARLLDPDGGHWSIRPVEPATAHRSYVGESLVLETVHETKAGAVRVTDCLALEPGARGHEIGHQSPRVLVRRVQGLRGTVRVRVELAPRHEYARVTPHLLVRDGVVVSVGGRASLALRAPIDFMIERDRAVAEVDVSAGDDLGFTLAYSPTFGPEQPAELDAEAAVANAVAGWEVWSEQHQTYDGEFRDLVRRSAIILQGLTYQRSGSVVAAATTSLPEALGGDRNYDYRYSWLRDFSFTMHALWVAACPDETYRLLQAVAGAIGRVGPHPVPVMTGIEGDRDLTEHELEHLDGYAGSRPVRVGNAAWQQEQLDVLGEVIHAAHELRDTVDELGVETRALLVGLANKIVDTWQDADAGMWEIRDDKRQFVSSKVMCWVGLDRAVALADALEVSDELVDRWTAAREEIRATVLERGWSESAGAFAAALDADDLDASALIIPLVGFLPIDDDRVRATIDAVEDRLASGGLVRRWDGDPAGFVLCSYWLVECRAMAGQLDHARAVFDRVTGLANDLGLFAEQLDPDTGEQLGNTPQALSHAGLINAAWRITEAAR